MMHLGRRKKLSVPLYLLGKGEPTKWDEFVEDGDERPVTGNLVSLRWKDRLRRYLTFFPSRIVRMITKITGMLNTVLDDRVRLQVGSLEYELWVSDTVRKQLQGKFNQ